MRSRALRSACVLLLASILATGCGGEEGVDRSRFEPVYEAAMAAVAARDLDALWTLLTPDGRDRVEAWLREWQALLRDPERGPYLVQRVEERLGPVPAEELERARKGTLRDAWTFFLRADPRPAAPPRRGLRIDPDGRRVVVDYESPQGTIRSVRLLRLSSGWAVDELQL